MIFSKHFTKIIVNYASNNIATLFQNYIKFIQNSDVNSQMTLAFHSSDEDLSAKGGISSLADYKIFLCARD